jgi:hypothetical protein
MGDGALCSSVCWSTAGCAQSLATGTLGLGGVRVFRLYVYTIQNTKRCGWGHGWGAEQSLREAEAEETDPKRPRGVLSTGR